MKHVLKQSNNTNLIREQQLWEANPQMSFLILLNLVKGQVKPLDPLLALDRLQQISIMSIWNKKIKYIGALLMLLGLAIKDYKQIIPFKIQGMKLIIKLLWGNIPEINARNNRFFTIGATKEIRMDLMKLLIMYLTLLHPELCIVKSKGLKTNSITRARCLSFSEVLKEPLFFKRLNRVWIRTSITWAQTKMLSNVMYVSWHWQYLIISTI
jgi:hypothetical protein